MTNTPQEPAEVAVEQSGGGALPPVSGRAQSRQFAFDGGAGTYIGTGLLAFFITVLTLGICYPFAFVLRERWRAKHSYIGGRQLVFTGRALGLFGNWVKWFFLIIITLGIYSFWVGPRLYRWKWENTSWAVQRASESTALDETEGERPPGFTDHDVSDPGVTL